MARMIHWQYNHIEPTNLESELNMFTPYSANALSIAYQLRWSLSIFPTVPIHQPINWSEELSRACEPDGIRVLETTVTANGCLLLLLSTQPQVTPRVIVQRVKGRLKHLLRERGGIDWRRNFRLSAVGNANASIVEQYVANQLGHHKMATQRATDNLTQLAWIDKHLKISEPIQSSHGQYAIALHIVLVHAERWMNADLPFVELTVNAIRGTLADMSCPASRIAILADHVHILCRLNYDIAPSELSVKVMNAVCESHGELRMWMEGCYIGTVGVYDMEAVRNGIERNSLKSRASTDTRSAES